MADKKKKRSGKSKKDVDKPAEVAEEKSAALISSEPVPPTETPTAAMSPVVGIPAAGNLAKSFSFILLLAIIGLIGVLSYRVMSAFVLPLFLAALLVVIFGPVHEWIKRFCRGHKSLAAGLTTAAILLVVLGPVGWMVAQGVSEGVLLADKKESWQAGFEKLGEARESLGLEMPFPDELADIQAQLDSLVLKEDRTNTPAEVKGKQQLLDGITGELRDFKQLIFADVLRKAGKVGGASPLFSQLQSNLASDQRSVLDGTIAVAEILDGIDVDPDGADAVPSPISRLRTVTEAAQREDGATLVEIAEFDMSVGLVREHFELAKEKQTLRGKEFEETLNLLSLKQDGTDPSEQVETLTAKLSDLKSSLLMDVLSNVESADVAAVEEVVASPQLTQLGFLLPKAKKEDEKGGDQAANGKEIVIEKVSDKAGRSTRIAILEKAERVIEFLDRIDVDQPAPSPLRRLQEIAKSEQIGRTEIDEYEEAVGLISGQYALARQTLMGGIGWAPIVELLNPSEARIDELRIYAAGKLRSWMLKLTGQTTSLMSGLLMQLFIFTVATFYFLADGPQMISSAMQLSPMDDKHEAEIISEFAKLSRAVVVATLLSAIVQGVLAGFGYFAVGLDSVLVLVVLTTILAMIPFVGAAAVWVPVCIYLAFVEKRIPAAIGFAIYGASVVSMADNVIKPWVLKGQSNLHPLFALLSVLGGVGALGPIGVLVGPMVVAFLQSLLKILHKEMHGVDSGVLDQRVA